MGTGAPRRGPMETSACRLTFWGVRGTVPTPAADHLGHGGNTICLAARLAEDEYLVLDCGTGVRRLGMEIAAKRAGAPTRIHVLFSHYHFDHVDGFPLFLPLYDPGTTLHIHGAAPAGGTVRRTLEQLVAPPYFPVRLAGVPARIEYAEVDGKPFSV